MNASLRKTLFSSLTAIFLTGLALAFSGCTPPVTGDPALIGKWGIDGKPVLEIRADGTWVNLGKKDPDVISSKWEWDGTNFIRVTYKTKIKDMENVTETLRIRLMKERDALIIRDTRGDDTEYARLK
jgi:hypothetical protein